MRKIIHVDADCFFAAVEIRDNPQLVGKPIAVGGDPRGRGVIATCSYEARRYGVRSAMPSSQALRLCPDLHFIKPNFNKYKVASEHIRTILSDFSELVEPLSLDEAYLDVTGSEQHHGSATLLARDLQQRVAREVGLSLSAGVSPVKFLAKIASDWRKPQGFYAVPPEWVEPFTARLPVARLPGVGPVANGRLQKLGLYYCADIRAFGLNAMTRHFGAHGEHLFDCAWGRDERLVKQDRERKSLSVERTYGEDKQHYQLAGLLPDLLQELERRLQPVASTYRVQTCFVKLKFDDFRCTTMEAPRPRQGQWLVHDTYYKLVLAAWHRQRRPVRLVGLGVRLAPHGDAAPQQLSLFTELDVMPCAA